MNKPDKSFHFQYEYLIAYVNLLHLPIDNLHESFHNIKDNEFHFYSVG